MAEDLPDRADAYLSRSEKCSSNGAPARTASPARADFTCAHTLTSAAPSVAGHCSGASKSPRTPRMSSWGARSRRSSMSWFGGSAPSASQALARGRGGTVLQACSARVAPPCRGAGFWRITRASGREACFPCLLCVVLCPVPVETLVTVRRFFCRTRPCQF